MAKKLRIALEDLRQAFDDRSGEYSWILDTETGEVLLLAEDSELPVSIEEIEEDQTGRFLGIDPEDPHEGYRDVEEFSATVADSRLRELLDVAIAGKGAFRRFKDVLIQAPQERERWFRFQEERVKGRLRGWLALELPARRDSTMTRPLRALLIAVGVTLLAAPAGAHDIPDEMRMHAWAKPDGDRLHVLVRVPLTLLLNLNLPKRGIGYLELAQLDQGLRTAIAATAKDLEFFEDGRRLTLATGEGRISIPSDRSFESYETAFANIRGPRLPDETDVFWNQGYFDAHLQYPIRSAQGGFSLDFHVSPGLGDRLKLDVRFISSTGAVRAYELRTGAGEVAIDPRWYQAAWIFIKAGFFHILDGADHLLFLFCLVIPFRRLRPLVAIITSFTVAHSVTLVAAAWGFAPQGKWFPPLVETLIAASIFYMALENVLAADLRRRWLITGAFGLVHGFGFSFVLKQDLQFVGSHLLLSLLSFNLGVELGQLLVLLIVLPVLALFFRLPFAPRYGVLLLSILIADTGWRWLLDRAANLWRVEWPIPRVATVLALLRWGALAALLAGATWLAIRSLRGRGHARADGMGGQVGRNGR